MLRDGADVMRNSEPLGSMDERVSQRKVRRRGVRLVRP